MSTFIINLNDTIAMSDSAIVELAKVVRGSESSVQEAATTWQDVTIVGFICLAVVLVVLIAKWATWSWKNAEIQAAKEERIAKEEKEREDCIRKQKADLLNKQIEFLKEYCYEVKEVPQGDGGTKSQKTLKAMNSKEVEAYLKALGYDFPASEKTGN